MNIESKYRVVRIHFQHDVSIVLHLSVCSLNHLCFRETEFIWMTDDLTQLFCLEDVIKISKRAQEIIFCSRAKKHCILCSQKNWLHTCRLLIYSFRRSRKSRRGRMIRKMLTRKGQQFEFFKKLIFSLLEQCLVVMVIYVAHPGRFLSIQIDRIMMILKFFLKSHTPFLLPIRFYFIRVSQLFVADIPEGNILILINKNIFERW